MAPRRSKTQKEGLINARAHRHQDGGSDSLDLIQDDQPVVNPELQRAQTKEENALVITEAQLQAELAHSKSFIDHFVWRGRKSLGQKLSKPMLKQMLLLLRKPWEN